jgi:prepilin-type N-terminal cleavage/methylation domain-containing protein/prepilin-type processing-associated H-X9-DG protein
VISTCVRCRHPVGRRAWTLLELITVLAIIGLLLALLLPALQSARQAARQATCQSNLRGWGQAIHAYLATHQRYPFAATWREGVRADGHAIPPRHSLFTYLLPFYDQVALAQHVNLHRDWNDPINEPWTKQWLGGILICPAAPDGRTDKHPADYTTAVRVDPSDQTGLGSLLRRGQLRDRSGRGPPAWGAGEDVWSGLLQLELVDYRRRIRQQRPTRPRDVLDGLSKTVVLFENAGKPLCYRDGRPADCQITRFRWASPNIWMTLNDVCRGQQLINCHNNSQPFGFHPGGINLAYADGAVRWISEQVAADVFVSALTRSGRD